MPLRKMPEVRPMSAMSSISLLAKTFFSRSSVESSTCIWPDEASAVSKVRKSASSGVSLISHRSMSTQKIMIAAGMKNTDQVASTSLPPTVTLVANIFWSRSWNQPPVEPALVSSTIRLPPVEREIDADGNERAKNRAEHAAFADVKPVGFDLDDGHRAVALEIHVDRV